MNAVDVLFQLIYQPLFAPSGYCPVMGNLRITIDVLWLIYEMLSTYTFRHPCSSEAVMTWRLHTTTMSFFMGKETLSEFKSSVGLE